MKKTKAEAEETAQVLLQTAKRHFAKNGYAKTALEDIVKDSGVTRGALYHHFKNKKGLFFAVIESIQKKIAQDIEQQASRGSEQWEQLSIGCRAFIKSAIEPDHKQIILIDGPAVIGWNRWRQLDANHSMKLLYSQLDQMQKNGCFSSLSVESLTHSLSGAMNESALWIAEQGSFDSLDEAMCVLDVYFEGLKQTN
ncbi:TetR family transcriptional regulator [Virgibacillus dakarensis]|uniref:TetR family transcriptional regulator n=1 Tax=Lentibacillus populi TaxID=1827502 RepID=A0A9W5X749_9BACI|nr:MULTISPECIES: TetR/AcrR family transcriptional regulator [Bacillaceae]MBT2214664.1 TetR/AcrR family transcriptional regulator [Virgibacillus dakarensis]MTW87956.1 TetR family transcriptional regulator [Virgibacillus dakarensis]GGB58174.1 TetR family transcriptional regulator [Lentibacillus populi]